MNDSNSSERDDVEKLADAFLASYRAGRRPSVDEFVSDYPDLAGELDGLLKAVMMLEQNAPTPDRLEEIAESQPAPLNLPAQIGDFLVVREIGRGGMGVVYEAVQQSLGRQVALKMLSHPGLLNPGHLERFRREARAAASLQHAHIVPVFGLGAHEGTYYYAMQYVLGQSLDLVIEQLRQSRAESGLNGSPPPTVGQTATPSDECPVPSVEGESDTFAMALSETEFSTSAGRRHFYRHVARIGLQAADALAYAHSEGVVHRDVKPSNLLLDAKGNIWITDFGLASADGDDELTHTGDFVGTLRYTAPERLEGWFDRRSDVYSLGVTLYELLTLKPFFANKSRAELLRRIVEDTPIGPRRIDASIPIDLETIVLKAVAKEPAARYHRAEQMADDLRRFLADRPIGARRSTLVERLGRWCRRNPAVASLAAAIVALLVTAVVVLARSNAEFRRESAAKAAALTARNAALDEKNEALGKAWLYRGLYGKVDEQESLHSFDEAVRAAPHNPDYLWLRGFNFGFLDRWDDALADMTKARPLLGKSPLITPASRDWFVAMAYLAGGKRLEYQAECRDALARITSDPSLDERGTLLWMCTITPDAIENASRLLDVIPAVLPATEAAPTSDRLLDVAAALFRADRLPAAKQRLDETLHQIAAGHATDDPNSEIFAHLFLAMAKARLGLADKANADLIEAEQLTKRIKPLCWVDELQLRLLFDETHAMLARSRPALVDQNAVE